ncbi:hypothetical protein [Solimicrobium silvestre]|nr:hypothetical protein [Solimicrobium silvestre]
MEFTTGSLRFILSWLSCPTIDGRIPLQLAAGFLIVMFGYNYSRLFFVGLAVCIDGSILLRR